MSSCDSLFDDDDELAVETSAPILSIGASVAPPIPGLYLFRSALPQELQHSFAAALSSSAWPRDSNQVMLFTSATSPSLPSFLSPLLDLLPSILSPSLPLSLSDLLFNSRLPRQAILNLYRPGHGITPHVDLPHRYEDGIVGISLGGSAVMDFTLAERIHSVLLRPGDVYVLSGDARYLWNHGIADRAEDWVQDEQGGEPFRLRRRLRMSITLRRMRTGADVVGAPGPAVETAQGMTCGDGACQDSEEAASRQR